MDKLRVGQGLVLTKGFEMAEHIKMKSKGKLRRMYCQCLYSIGRL